MTDPGNPIAYTALAKDAPVLSASGTQFGTVEHVLQIPDEDIFDGIVVRTDRGLRFIDSDAVTTITTTHVDTTLSDSEAAALPEPDGTQEFETDPAADSGRSLSDVFGRLFGRPHWTQRT